MYAPGTALFRVSVVAAVTVIAVAFVDSLVFGVSPSEATGGMLSPYSVLFGIDMMGAHLLADALTPLGIGPFNPLSVKFTFDITDTANLIAGYTLVVGGGVLAGAAFFTGSVLAACGSLSPTLDPLTQAPIPASN